MTLLATAYNFALVAAIKVPKPIPNADSLPGNGAFQTILGWSVALVAYALAIAGVIGIGRWVAAGPLNDSHGRAAGLKQALTCLPAALLLGMLPTLIQTFANLGEKG